MPYVRALFTFAFDVHTRYEENKNEWSDPDCFFYYITRLTEIHKYKIYVVGAFDDQAWILRETGASGVHPPTRLGLFAGILHHTP